QSLEIRRRKVTELSGAEDGPKLKYAMNRWKYDLHNESRRSQRMRTHILLHEGACMTSAMTYGCHPQCPSHCTTLRLNATQRRFASVGARKMRTQGIETKPNSVVAICRDR